jgi:hypothetical protein
MALAVPSFASAAPAAERRSADAELTFVGSDGARYTLELAVVHVVPFPTAVLSASLSRCDRHQCVVTSNRRQLDEQEFSLPEGGDRGQLQTSAFGVPLQVSWQATSAADVTLATVRASSASTGAGIDEETRAASAKVRLGDVNCSTNSGRVQRATFAGAALGASDETTGVTPTGLLRRHGRSPSCGRA